MNASTILQAAELAGVKLVVSPDGKLKATGLDEAVNKWLPKIREHKAEILEVLRRPDNSIRPLSDEYETLILDWLSRIGETDIVTIAEVIDKCRCDLDARAYFVGRANER